MEVNIEIIKDFLVVNLKGEIDHHNAFAIRSEVDRKIEETKIYNLIFNFSKITFMDSSGIGMVIGRYRLLKVKDGKVFVTNLSKDVYRIFEISGLFKIINNYDTINQCIEENDVVEV